MQLDVVSARSKAQKQNARPPVGTRSSNFKIQNHDRSASETRSLTCHGQRHVPVGAVVCVPVRNGQHHHSPHYRQYGMGDQFDRQFRLGKEV